MNSKFVRRVKWIKSRVQDFIGLTNDYLYVSMYVIGMNGLGPSLGI